MSRAYGFLEDTMTPYPRQKHSRTERFVVSGRDLNFYDWRKVIELKMLQLLYPIVDTEVQP